MKLLMLLLTNLICLIFLLLLITLKMLYIYWAKTFCINLYKCSLNVYTKHDTLTHGTFFYLLLKKETLILLLYDQETSFIHDQLYLSTYWVVFFILISQHLSSYFDLLISRCMSCVWYNDYFFIHVFIVRLSTTPQFLLQFKPHSLTYLLSVNLYRYNYHSYTRWMFVPSKLYFCFALFLSVCFDIKIISKLCYAAWDIWSCWKDSLWSWPTSLPKYILQCYYWSHWSWWPY